MKRTILTVAVLAVASLASTATMVRAADLSTATLHQVFSTDKGLFRPDWAAGQNRPVYIDTRLSLAQIRAENTIVKATPEAPKAKAPYALTGQTKEAAPSPPEVRRYNDKGRRL